MSKGYGHYRNWIYAKYDLLGNVIHETYARLDEVTNDNNLAYVGDWQQNGSYFKNDLVSYEDKTYKVIQDVSGSLVPPSEDEEHYVEFNSDIVSFIPLTSASGTLDPRQMRYILASKNTSLVYNDRVYQQVGTANGSTNFVSFGTINNENYIYVITVASNGSYTRTSNRIVKEEEVATDLGINEPNNLVYLVRGETKLGNGATFKTINGVSIIGSGNIVVGESGTIAIDDELSTTSENAVQNKVITAELNTKAVLGAFNGGGTGVDYADLANNLIASKGLEVESYFTFEKTGGEQASAIETGNGTLKNLYGKTEKSENLIVLNNGTLTEKGTTRTITSGRVAYSGTWTSGEATQMLQMTLTAGTYTLTCFWSKLLNDYNAFTLQNANSPYETITSVYTNTYPIASRTFTLSETKTILLRMNFVDNADLTGFALYPMLVKGSVVPTEWKQGYEGLKHTHITGLKSTGINLWDEEWELGYINSVTGQNENGSTTIRSKNYIRVNPNTQYYFKRNNIISNLFEYDSDFNFIKLNGSPNVFTTSPNCYYIKFYMGSDYGTTYNHDICINKSDPTINGNYYHYEEDTLDIDFEGNGVGTAFDEINVEEKKKYTRTLEVTLNGSEDWYFGRVEDSSFESGYFYYAQYSGLPNTILKPITQSNPSDIIWSGKVDSINSGRIANSMYISTAGTLQLNAPNNNTITTKADFLTWLSNNPLTIVIPLAEPIGTDITISKDTIKVWNGGSMEALGTEAPVGTKIFYQKNIKSFVEAFGEAIDWNPDRIERLAKLSITPEYVNISLNPSQENAYAVAQVYNATFTIVISTALMGTASGSITFQDSEIDLSSFETQPAESIYDMDGNKVSEEPTTPDCNIASFVGRSYNGVVLWSLLHSGVNKVKVHFEQAIPLDSEGNGKLDCRASLIL